MDVIAGCSGFVYALATASQFVDSGAAETALVVGSETLSRISDYTDRGTCILFGDGAGAAVLRRGERGVRAFSLGADGGRSRLLMTPAGGSRFPANSRTVAERRHYIVMEGREVFKGAVTAMAASSLQAIELGPASRPRTSTWSSPTRPTSGSSRPPPGGSRSRR